MRSITIVPLVNDTWCGLDDRSGMALRVLIAVLVLLAAPGAAHADKLPASVHRVDPDPVVAIATEASGATPLERYRAAGRGPWTARQRLVVLVRLDDVSSPDVVEVTAERKGKRIAVTIEVRRYTGPLAANVVTTPLVEVELGRLAAGRYEVRVDETILEFDDLDRPDLATNPRAGLGSRMSFEVRRR